MRVKAKYIHVRDSLLQDVRCGKFKEGERIPSERDLAKQYDVSHMTARKAVSQLVESGFLEPRRREGIFLSANALKRTQKQTFHLICSTYEHPEIRDFLRAGQRFVIQRNGNPHVIRVNENQSQIVIRALMSGSPCLIFGNESYRDKAVVSVMQETASNVVVVGENLTGIGVNSVMCDDAAALRTMVDLLKKNGHEKIALISHHVPANLIDQTIISAWKASFPNENSEAIEKRLLVVVPPPYECCSSYVNEAVKDYVQSPGFDVTAFICLHDEAAIGASAACREAGFRIPEDISFVNYGDSSAMKFANPAITCVSRDMSRHVELAMELFDQKQRGGVKIVQPKLIERESVFNRSK